MKRWFYCFFVIGVIASTFLGHAGLSQSADYAVRADDRLRIQIYQLPELTNEYKVSSNGTITIPPLGEVPVAGLSAQEISARISEGLIKAGVSDKPGTTVIVVESRPIYVMGDVQKPGEYPYRPGLTALQAIGLAGGYYRVSDPGLLRLERDAINISGELSNLTRRYYYMVARRARLTSELELVTEPAFPAEMKDRAAKDQALQQVIDQERSLLRINVGNLKQQIDSLERTRALYEREIEAVDKQIQAGKTQIEIVGKELNVVKALFARGLTTVSRQSDLERSQAQMIATEQGFQTLMLRARQNITQIDQKIFDLKEERRAKLSAELQQTRLELEETFNRIETNRRLMMEAQITAPVLAAGSDDSTDSHVFLIVRSEDGRKTTIRADDHLELQPGDVLKVQRNYSPISPEFGSASLRAPG